MPHPDHRPPSRRWPLLALALLMLSLMLAQIYKQPLLSLLGGTPTATQISPPPCDLNRQACPLLISTPAASEAPWSFAISPRPIPVSAPLTLTLTPPEQNLSSNRLLRVWVDLTGDSMDMGLIQVPLTLSPDGHWEGTGSIPICVTGPMRWRAQLHMQLEQTTLQADWVFNAPSTVHPHGNNGS